MPPPDNRQYVYRNLDCDVFLFIEKAFEEDSPVDDDVKKPLLVGGLLTFTNL